MSRVERLRHDASGRVGVARGAGDDVRWFEAFAGAFGDDGALWLAANDGQRLLRIADFDFERDVDTSTADVIPFATVGDAAHPPRFAFGRDGVTFVAVTDVASGVVRVFEITPGRRRTSPSEIAELRGEDLVVFPVASRDDGRLALWCVDATTRVAKLLLLDAQRRTANEVHAARAPIVPVAPTWPAGGDRVVVACEVDDRLTIGCVDVERRTFDAWFVVRGRLERMTALADGTLRLEGERDVVVAAGLQAPVSLHAVPTWTASEATRKPPPPASSLRTFVEARLGGVADVRVTLPSDCERRELEARFAGGFDGVSFVWPGEDAARLHVAFCAARGTFGDLLADLSRRLALALAPDAARYAQLSFGEGARVVHDDAHSRWRMLLVDEGDHVLVAAGRAPTQPEATAVRRLREVAAALESLVIVDARGASRAIDLAPTAPRPSVPLAMPAFAMPLPASVREVEVERVRSRSGAEWCFERPPDWRAWPAADVPAGTLGRGVVEPFVVEPLTVVAAVDDDERRCAVTIAARPAVDGVLLVDWLEDRQRRFGPPGGSVEADRRVGAQVGVGYGCEFAAITGHLRGRVVAVEVGGEVLLVTALAPRRRYDDIVATLLRIVGSVRREPAGVPTMTLFPPDPRSRALRPLVRTLATASAAVASGGVAAARLDPPARACLHRIEAEWLPRLRDAYRTGADVPSLAGLRREAFAAFDGVADDVLAAVLDLDDWRG